MNNQITKKKQRDRTIDIMKGMCMFAVVAVHGGFTAANILGIYMLASYFMITGYFSSDKNSDSLRSVGDSIHKRIKRIYIPYLIVNLVLVLLNNVFMDLNFYGSDPDFITKATELGWDGERVQTLASYFSVKDYLYRILRVFLFYGEPELAGACWFLRATFVADIVFICIQYLLKKISRDEKFLMIAQIVLSVVLLCVGHYGFRSANPVNLIVKYALEYYILFVMGSYIKKFKLLDYFKGTLVRIITILVTIGIVYCLSKVGKVVYSRVEMTNPLFFIVGSIVGFFQLYSISGLLDKYVDKVAKFTAYVGANTLPVLMLHFICFKLVTFIIIKYNSYPSYMLAMFPSIPSYKVTDFFWIAYFASGLCLTLGGNAIYVRIKKKVKLSLSKK